MGGSTYNDDPRHETRAPVTERSAQRRFFASQYAANKFSPLES
jgi:hypothetical protein